MTSPFLSEDQKNDLLGLARETLTAKLTTGAAVRPETNDPVLLAKRGAFVTLKVGGNLRGCVGYPLPVKPLAETVVEMVVAAATRDWRFTPLDERELDDLEIEISVLTLPRPIQDVKDIVVGRHGIIVSKGHNKGLLLPQVPLEQHWDLETYLRHGCLKAGLAENEWKRGAKIEVFEAQVFSEH
jgi:AmmeMemoRadiSam system protein A